MSFITDFLYLYGRITDLVLVNCLLALAMYVNLSSGQFSVAVPAFTALGAYTAAILTVKLHWPFALVLLAGIALPAAFAYLFGLPILKLQGVYLAMATLGLVQVIQILLINLDITGGPMGLVGIPVKTQTGYLVLAVALFLYLLWVIQRSKLGSGLQAMRHDWQLARVMGVNLERYNMYAFVLSAAMAGLAGGLAAHSQNALTPGDYGFNLVVALLTFCIVGGVGSLAGPLLGALLLSILPELLQSLQEHRLVFNGLVVLLVTLFLKGGLVGLCLDLWRLLKGGRRSGAAASRARV